MITVKSDITSETKVSVSNGQFSLEADTAPPKGASDGFRPHELLEAGLAGCTAITLRIAARERNVPIEQLTVKAELDRSDPSNSTFRLRIEFGDDVSESDREALIAIARQCPVRNTLSKGFGFEFS